MSFTSAAGSLTLAAFLSFCGVACGGGHARPSRRSTASRSPTRTSTTRSPTSARACPRASTRRAGANMRSTISSISSWWRARRPADKVDGDPEFERKLAYYKDKLAMEQVLGKIAKAADTPDAEHAAYDAAAKAQPPEDEVHARHILLPDEATAKTALARVKAGEDFAKVADELSKDPGSKGGDLGWFTKDRMVPEFANEAFKLQPGQVSDPVKTQFGWHIIKVEGKRTKTFPPFEQVKDQAAHYVAQKAQSDLITSLRKDAKIERFDTPPAAPASSGRSRRDSGAGGFRDAGPGGEVNSTNRAGPPARLFWNALSSRKARGMFIPAAKQKLREGRTRPWVIP